VNTFTCFNPAATKSIGSILLVHGAGEHSGKYEWVISQWNQAGYDVLCGDLPGYGRSEGKKGHIDRFEDYIDAVQDWYELLIRESPHVPFVVGHSLGGLVTARFMEIKKPIVTGVIMSSPCFGLSMKVPKWKQLIANGLNVLYPSLVLASGLEDNQVSRSPRVADDPLSTSVASVRWYRELILNIEKNVKESKGFPDVPLLVYQAGEDLVVDREQVKRWISEVPIKNKTYKEWPGLYHEILNDPEKENVMDEMIRWMRRQPL
jgi:lysophospholipase